ncbi:MAG: 4-(cytidine 5-diphospho)-2-C-methyl-D-erythritol kinase [Verrucomicrobiota bacterium]|jgi:4-diphosphocytidyl-2-C-methyl-D-erythritol kinase
MAVLSTPGKINLFLDVTGRRADGYHDIETLFLPVPGLCDRVELSPSTRPGLTLVCEAEGVPCDERNLAWKAAEAYFRQAGRPLPALQLRIDKKLPVAGGMGGGSSDAAAVLRLLNQEHGQLSDAELHHIALAIGADVPFFLDPRPASASGIGEVLRPIPKNGSLFLVFAFSAFPIPAAWAYKNRLGPFRSAPRPFEGLLQALAAGDTAGVAAHLHNGLAPAIRRKFPLLEKVRRDLVAGGCLAAEVSGSGPTVFGIAPDAAAAEACRLSLIASGWPAAMALCAEA